MKQAAPSRLTPPGTSRKASLFSVAALILATSLAMPGEAKPGDGAPHPLSRRPVEGRISGGTVGVHAIPIGPGEYAGVEVEHDRMELTFRVFGPEGEIDQEMKSIFGEGRTRVELTAAEAATFELHIEPTYPRAGEGKYRVRLRAVRRASERDRLMHAGRRARAGAEQLRKHADFSGARSEGEKALQILESVPGAGDAELSATLSVLASIAYAQGEYGRASLLYRRALDLALDAFGEDHPAVAEVEEGLAKNILASGDFAEARRLARKALSARQKALGSNHILVASSMATLAGVHLEARELSEAEELSDTALEIAGLTWDSDSLDYQWFVSGVAAAQTRRGNFDRAEKLLEQSLSVRERDAGSESLDACDSLYALAFLYLQKRDDLKATELGLRALRLAEGLLGRDHPRLSDHLNNLGLLSFRRRDFAAARAYYDRSLAIAEKSVGLDHFSMARTFNNLGLVDWREGDYPKAAEHFQRTLALMEKTFGPENPHVMPALGNLGIIAKETGDYERAEALYLRAVAIIEKAYGPHHRQLVVPLESLGILYRDRGDHALAEPFFLRVMEMTAASLGPEHPDVARHLSNLAQLYAASGERSKALKVLQRRTSIEEKYLPLQLAAGSERQKLAFLEPFEGRFDEVITFHVGQAASDAGALDLAATALLQRKGRVLDVMANGLVALRERSADAERTQLDELTEATAQLAALVLGGPQELPLSEHQERIAQLNERRDRLEDELNRRSIGYFERGDAVTLAAVKAAIPANAVLVEFVVYQPFDPKTAVESTETYGEPRYVAYVIPPEGDVQWRELGPAGAIDEAVDALRQALRDPRRKDVQAISRALDTQVMEPIRGLLGNPERLMISPDGQLHLMPFEALVDEDGRYLIERHAISYLSSGRDLLRMQVRRPSRGAALLVADPLFGEPVLAQLAGDAPVAMSEPGRRGITMGEGLARVYFGPLTGTAHEARSIKALFPEARILTRSEATEGSVKRIVAPEILHIATHGFFLGDSVAEGGSARTADRHAVQAKVEIENPLLRSGLALSGANLRDGGAEDGILTALEASSLDLWGTKLVTLSACDTGVGEVRNGEGVYGLRRAFFLAGTETLVMSLWPVSDSVTRKMMTEYYSGLKEGLGRGDALRRAQLTMLSKKSRSHPFYWASFIQSGEWASLDGRR
jgi:CHAT domain-containing protein